MGSKLKLIERIREREEPAGLGKTLALFAGLLAAFLGAADLVPDVNIDELDPGIRRHVLALCDAGFTTTDSGDGISKLGGPGEACMLDMPNVAIVLDDVDCLIEEALGAQRVLDEIEDGWRVEASWSTYDRVPVLLCLRVPEARG